MTVSKVEKMQMIRKKIKQNHAYQSVFSKKRKFQYERLELEQFRKKSISQFANVFMGQCSF